ncbi:hypothetical protein ASG35_27185 [Burkholderia sp. Leaf177]|nr:hypothetical protein ASG35_27185 [Burkholderia sp. Leaf177]
MRGIGRYSLALAKAIVRNAGGNEVWIVLSDLFPDSIEQIRETFAGIVPDERIVVFSLPQFAFYQDPGNWRVRAATLIREHAIAEIEPDLVHISSLFEGYVDQSISSVKALDAHTLVSVTLYDLIPFLNPAKYLADAGMRQHYFGKIDALKRADLLLAISAYCGEEAVRELGIGRERVTNISSAASDNFVARALTAQVREAVLARYGVSRRAVMTAGIVEPRKNLEGLIAAYSKLPATQREQHQLFMVCQPQELSRIRLLEFAASCGLAPDEIVLSGYVTDDDLVALYQACELFVFPSFHEGFGLPALEAMACGALVVASSATSIPEVIGREDALFDPHNTQQMADLMQRALTDEDYRESLRAHAAVQAAKFSWDATGQRAVRAFEQAFAKRNERDLSRFPPPDKTRRYENLLNALTDLDAVPTDADLIASADAIALNRRSGQRRQLLVDVSILADHDARSGIQRVTRAIFQQLHSACRSGWTVRPVRLDRGAMAYRYANAFLNESAPGSEFACDPDEWLDTQPGDVFLGLDLVADRIPDAIAWFGMQRRRGVKVYFVVYDLLPVLRPEWFHEGIARVFPPWVETITTVADGLVAISRAVADNLQDWLVRHKPKRERSLRIGYFHLGADIGNSQPSTGLPDNAADTLAAIRSRPTILMVGTVEPRKGYVQAVAAFEELWASYVDVNLVIVGKAGWGVDELVPQLARHADANKRFFWLQGISDEFLEDIYASSSCLLAASLGEGFGLPLIEAAQQRISIIARDIPVFREVAGDHAFYFTGDTASDLASAIQSWLALFAAGTISATTLPWLTWQQSAKQLEQVIYDGEWYQTWCPK